MGKSRIMVYILLIFCNIAFIPMLYLIASLPEIRVTAWGTSFFEWFDITVVDVMSVIEDADELSAGWEIWIIAIVIFFIPLSILGLVSCYDGVRSIHKRSRVVDGVVQESQLSEKIGEYATVYNVTITYQFIADGKEYKNTDTLSDMWSNAIGEHQRRLQQYPPGTKISILYEPGKLENHEFQKFDTRSNVWIIVPLTFSILFYALFSWLSGFFLALFLHNFPGLSPGNQLITGIFLAGILVGFVFYARLFYKKILSGEKSNLESTN